MGVMMLNDFTTYLMETDVTKLTWAQYMEVDMHSNGTGLLDYWGNARPSWHTFRFWGDLPIERMVSLQHLLMSRKAGSVLLLLRKMYLCYCFQVLHTKERWECNMAAYE